MESLPEPLTAQELVQQLYDQHDAELHAIFQRMIDATHTTTELK